MRQYLSEMAVFNAGDIVRTAIAQEIPFRKHHIDFLSRPSVGEAVSYVEYRLPLLPQTSDMGNLAVSASSTFPAIGTLSIVMGEDRSEFPIFEPQMIGEKRHISQVIVRQQSLNVEIQPVA